MQHSELELDAWMSVLIVMADPFQRATDRDGARPCWQTPEPFYRLSKLRQIALIEGAAELNQRSAEYWRDYDFGTSYLDDDSGQVQPEIQSRYRLEAR